MTAIESLGALVMHYENQRARVAGVCLLLDRSGKRGLADELRRAIEWRQCGTPGCVVESGHTSPHLIATPIQE